MSTQTIPAPVDIPAAPNRGYADLEMVHRGKVLSVLIDSLILARRLAGVVWRVTTHHEPPS